MKKRFLLLIIMTAMLALPIRAEVWNIDPVHSTIGFSVRHMVISKVPGEFRDYDGQITFDGKNLAQGQVDITIQMASIDTRNEDRDKHLRSADFFDVEKFPVMTFKSKKITPGMGNAFALVGDLTIKGITREVTLNGEFNGTMVDPWGNTRAGFAAETTINRQDFNVSWSNALQDGSLVVGNGVTINLEIELIKAK